MIHRLLLVEDSRTYSKALVSAFSKETTIEIDWAASLAEAQTFIASGETTYSLAILDLTLPDAPRGEIVPYCIEHKIPSIVCTGTYNSDVRTSLFEQGVIDYVLKDSPIAMEYLVKLVLRLLKNKQISAIITANDEDVANSQRKYIKNLQFKIYEAKSSLGTRKLLYDHPEISIAFIGEKLRDTSGLELSKACRKYYPSSALSIIALPEGDRELAAKFIKYGADDYVLEPTTPEEFYIRVNNTVETKEQLHKLERAANHDFMTGLLNRRAFFEKSETYMNQARLAQGGITVAMLDIDKFKRINDTYGHDVGDEAIIALADCLSANMRSTDLIARFGGEEFAILSLKTPRVDQEKFYDQIRTAISEIRIPIAQGDDIHFTASIGVTNKFDTCLDHMLQASDANLYTAKETGRNRVVIT